MKYTIVEETCYPFEDEVRFTLKSDKPVRVALRCRIPGWCDSPDAGKLVTCTLETGRTLALALPVKLTLESDRNWHWIRRGALTFSFVPPATVTEDEPGDPFTALRIMPRPGAWMPWVNRLFAVVMFVMALWYGWNAWNSWQTSDPASSSPTAQAEEGRFEATPATWKQTFDAAKATGKPVFVDVWATWCKNCLAMEKTTFKNDDVRKELEKFAVIRLQAEKPEELLALPEFKDLNIKGLPAFVVFPAKP